MRSGVSEAGWSHATCGRSLPSGNLQRLQPGEFRRSQQHADESAVRPLDADAGERSRDRWCEWRFQSSLSGWRATLRSVGCEASILSEVTSQSRPNVVTLGLVLAGVLLVRCSSA